MPRFEVQNVVRLSLLDSWDVLEWGDYLPGLTEGVTNIIYMSRVIEGVHLISPACEVCR